MVQPITRKMNKTEISGMTDAAIRSLLDDFDAKKNSLAARPKEETVAFLANVKIAKAVQAERLRNR